MSQKKLQDAVPSQPKPVKPTSSSVKRNDAVGSPPKPATPPPSTQTRK